MQQSDALYLFNEGRNFQAYRLLGAEAGASGTRFRVWAPNASQVLVLGDFNAWQGEAHVMHALSGSGIWELEVPEAVPGSLYRFAITNRETGVVHIKSDPYARGFEKRPGSAAYVVEPSLHVWADDAWLQARAAWDWQQAPVNIYEVHAGSWMRHPDGTPYLWRELAERLIPYAVAQGYTHLELLPITEGIRQGMHPDVDMAKIKRAAIQEGLRPLRLAGAMKVAEGLTTLDEVVAGTPPLE